MSPRGDLLSLLIASLALLALLLVSFTNAKPLVGEKAEASLSLSTTTSSLSPPSTHTSSKWRQKILTSSPFDQTSTATPSTRQVNKAALTAKARIPVASSSGRLATFCEEFVKQCYKIALKGQTGEVTVSYSCRRDGDKDSTSFTYSCTSNGRRVTGAVLKAIGQAYHRPTGTTTIDKMRVETRLVEDVATATRTTTKVTTSAVATTTNTFWKDVVDVEVETIPSTVSSTTVIPYTLSLTLEATRTARSTATTSVTVTQTEVFIDSGEVPVYQVTVSEDEEAGPQRRAPSNFCLAYQIACEGECARVSSRVKTWICQSDLPRYTLACECRNGKKETQHAIQAVAENRKIRSITKLGTSTVYLTSTRTTTLVKETLRTRLATVTSSVERTSTISTSTSTTTEGKTTRFTGRSSAIETDVSTIYPTTTTIITTTTIPIPTTTRLVLAATGFIHGFDTTDGMDLGRIVQSGDEPFAFLIAGPPSSGTQFMAVRDSPTGLYQFADTENPAMTLLQYGNITDPVFRGGVPYYGHLYISPARICGTAGTSAGPPDPAASWPCETFLISPLALDPSPGATPDTLSLRPFWINPLQSNPANHSGVWAYFNSVPSLQSTVIHVADKAAYLARYPDDSMTWFTMRFPFET